jgi:arylsulfatase A-like enzyme
MYMPDILVGAESYQHLPGILRAEGYYTVQYGFPYYVDAYKINMLDSFDMANGRARASSPLLSGLRQYLPGELAYFIYETANRAADRLRHIFFIEAMADPNDMVVAGAHNQSDDEKVETLLASLEEFDQPMFIHLHLLEAHGPVYSPEKKVFSRGLAFDDQGEWNRNFYDDAILEVDADIGRVVAALEEHGLLEDTLLIIGSDHAMGFEQRQRVPLLMRFPGAAISGRVEENVQGLDIAPTILDYLGLPKPAWMSGQSLLAETFETRYIIGAGVGPLAQNENRIWVIDPQRSKPPFYQFGTINVIDCNVWYELDLADQSLSSGEVSGHTAPCPAEEVLTPEEAFELMVASLRENGFEVAELEGMDR